MYKVQVIYQLSYQAVDFSYTDRGSWNSAQCPACMVYESRNYINRVINHDCQIYYPMV